MAKLPSKAPKDMTKTHHKKDPREAPKPSPALKEVYKHRKPPAAKKDMEY